jgi:hypothetical protein
MIEVTIPDFSDHSLFFHQLVVTTQTRFMQTGEIEYLDESISFLQKAQNSKILIDNDTSSPDEQTEMIHHCFDLTARTVDLEQADKYTEEITRYSPSEYLNADALDIGEEYFFLVSI